MTGAGPAPGPDNTVYYVIPQQQQQHKAGSSLAKTSVPISLVSPVSTPTLVEKKDPEKPVAIHIPEQQGNTIIVTDTNQGITRDTRPSSTTIPILIKPGEANTPRSAPPTQQVPAQLLVLANGGGPVSGSHPNPTQLLPVLTVARAAAVGADAEATTNGGQSQALR